MLVSVTGKRLAMPCAVLLTLLPVAACSSEGESACTSLRRELGELTAKAQSSSQAWNDINGLQKSMAEPESMAEIEQLKARFAGQCSG